MAILDLDPPLRPGVIARLMRIEGMAPLLPWDDWLEEAPELYSAAGRRGRHALRLRSCCRPCGPARR